ncbi:hypothetical protein [Natrarchaeobius oligotrophus]|uniref:Uncharacterized protein n=1 Tax=Natrarchaeobius chitinivorans TaxID=1679083 RepID=A0A3N6M9R7_NATCH|nr:hypothetical protein [Natrarchaeobius chitinivorans]RQG99187.1 hypothetical protein EA472_15060 [Natrarchaeobius chitinivorans]
MSYRDRFWNVVCTYRSVLVMVLAVLFVLALLNLFAFVQLDRSAETFPIVLLNFAILGSLLALTGITLWGCKRHLA